MRKLTPTIARLPEWLQKKIRDYKDGFFPDENGILHKMGGYGDDYDWLGCMDEIADDIIAESQSWRQCRRALLFLGIKRSQLDNFWPDFDRKK